MTPLPEIAPPSTPAPFRGGGFREVILLAFPVVLTQLSTSLMGVVDSAMVGRLGATELAAVGFGGIWLWTLFAILFGTASGIQTFVSQADGAGDSASCGPWVWQGLYSVLPAAVLLIAIVAWLLEPALALLGPSLEMRNLTADYVQARLIGELGFAIVMVVNSFYRGLGDTRTPLYITLFANAVNFVLDYGLIFGKLGLPEWGVTGAGIATAIAQWSNAIVLLAIFQRRSIAKRCNTRPVALNLRQIRRFLWTGAPIGGQWFIGMMSFSAFTTLVARMGDTSMAASQAFVMLLSLSFMQAVGISIAGAILVGRYIGAKRPSAAIRTFRSSILLGLSLSGCIAIAFIAIPIPLLRIFTDDPAVLALGRPLLLIGALYQLADAAAIISEGALRGAGDTRWPFAVETALGWGLLVPLAYYVGVVLDYGLTGAWLASLLHIVILAATLSLRFRSNSWQKIRI
ncbi:MAG: MATE family efflux transporter [Deltaproteobacteria bacterium]|nr:MATE family efflux transporter [Deltaproteobacteria bacterium]